MTATITDNEQDVFELLDISFEQEFACEGFSIKGCPDEAPAVYRMRFYCCSRIYMMCEECLFYTIEIMRNYAGEPGTCAACSENFVIDPSHVVVLGRVK